MAPPSRAIHEPLARLLPIQEFLQGFRFGSRRPAAKPLVRAPGLLRRLIDYLEFLATLPSKRTPTFARWRYELDLTEQDVAERAGTSHSFVSKLEAGDHIPTILANLQGVPDCDRRQSGATSGPLGLRASLP